MALWKITVKTSGNVNGVRLEKGMSVECVTSSTSNPLQANLTKKSPKPPVNFQSYRRYHWYCFNMHGFYRAVLNNIDAANV